MKKINLGSVEDVSAVYVIKATNDTYSKYQKGLSEALLKQRKLLNDVTKTNRYSKIKQNEVLRSAIDLSDKTSVNKDELIREITEIQGKMKSFQSELKYEAVLNKNQTIFPDKNDSK